MTTHSDLVNTADESIKNIFNDESVKNDITRDSLVFLMERIEDLIFEIDSNDDSLDEYA